MFLNILHELRFKWENVLLLGIIPGPTEPKLDINSYLQPIVDELLLFWNGQVLIEGGKNVFYKIALLCISSDIPATRKCCGFMTHYTLKGTFLYILLIFSLGAKKCLEIPSFKLLEIFDLIVKVIFSIFVQIFETVFMCLFSVKLRVWLIVIF